MSEQIYFESDLSSATTSNRNSPATYTKPIDDFNTPLSPTPHTIFYLATIKPHTNEYLLHGPVTTFLHLLPKIQDIVSNSPRAIDKLEELRAVEDIWGEKEANHAFEQNGFETFVVEGQRGIYTVLKILRETNAPVCESLPAPVYTVVKAGPLVHRETEPCFGIMKGRPYGYAAETRLVGSFVEREEARRVAREAMQDMTGGQKGVKCTETWEAGSKGGGLLMAMSPGQLWEVKVMYEDQALRRAREGFDRDGEKVGWRF